MEGKKGRRADKSRKKYFEGNLLLLAELGFSKETHYGREKSCYIGDAERGRMLEPFHWLQKQRTDDSALFKRGFESRGKLIRS